MSQQTITSEQPSSIRLTLEKYIVAHPQFWRKIHDSTKVSDGETRKVFVRVYEFVLMGEPTGLGIRFFYDYRNGGLSSAKFDDVILKAIEHQMNGDYQEEKMKPYIEKKTNVKPWWKLA